MLVRTLFDETWARFSPDGRSIAYMSNESGRWEVYVRVGERRRIARPRVDQRRRLAVLVARRQDGVFHRQRPHDGIERAERAELVASAPSIVPGADAMVLAGGATAGDRLLVRQAGAHPPGRAELRVVLEWFTELSKRIQSS